jgi:hypothetical protein
MVVITNYLDWVINQRSHNVWGPRGKTLNPENCYGKSMVFPVRKVLEKTLEPYWDYEGASFVDRLAMGHEFWLEQKENMG